MYPGTAAAGGAARSSADHLLNLVPVVIVTTGGT